MNLTNFVWLLVGTGLGVLVSQIKSRSRRPIPPQVEKALVTESPMNDVRSLQEQLQQTELAYAMATQMSQFKGSFLARTSHELRSPLNGIIGMHQLILSDLADNSEEERDFLAQANNSALKMVHLLDEVIDVAKVEHGVIQIDLQPTQLTTLLRSVYSLTHLQAENRTIQFTVEYPFEEVFVVAEPRRLRQGLVTLIDTAIAHLQEGCIQLWVENPPGAEHCYICIQTPISQAAWELDERSTSSHQNSLTATSSKAAFIQTMAIPFPSTGFAFSVVKSLLQSMKGELEVKTVGNDTATGSPISQLRCIIPLVPFEPSID